MELEKFDYICEKLIIEIMTIKIPANAKKVDIDKMFKNLNQEVKPFDARNFVGKIKFRTDPLELQRDLR